MYPKRKETIKNREEVEDNIITTSRMELCDKDQGKGLFDKKYLQLDLMPLLAYICVSLAIT